MLVSILVGRCGCVQNIGWKAIQNVSLFSLDEWPYSQQGHQQPLEVTRCLTNYCLLQVLLVVCGNKHTHEGCTFICTVPIQAAPSKSLWSLRKYMTSYSVMCTWFELLLDGFKFFGTASTQNLYQTIFISTSTLSWKNRNTASLLCLCIKL